MVLEVKQSEIQYLINSLSSHVIPPYPLAQKQSNVIWSLSLPGLFVHVAPFLHGCLAHGSLSETIIWLVLD